MLSCTAKPVRRMPVTHRQRIVDTVRDRIVLCICARKVTKDMRQNADDPIVFPVPPDFGFWALIFSFLLDGQP